MSLLDLEFFLASLSILASMRPVNLQICTGPLLATTRVCSSEAGSESRPCWIFSYCILQMRFLDQFALDLRSQRTNQPPGGPVPCTTADVRVTELYEMDIADRCHDFVSLYIDIYNFPNIVKRTVTAIRFWWFFTRFFLASKHICKMQIRHSIARAEWFPWDAWKFGPAFERQPASTAPEMSVVRTWLGMPLHVVSRFVHQVAHCFHPVRQRFLIHIETALGTAEKDVWLSIPSPGLVDHAWPWPQKFALKNKLLLDQRHFRWFTWPPWPRFQSHLEYPVLMALGSLVLLTLLLGCLAVEAERRNRYVATGCAATLPPSWWLHSD